MKFQVGDKVRYKPEHQYILGSAVHTVLVASVGISTVTEDRQHRTTERLELVEPASGYEDGWRLNDGVVEIPRTAKVLKDDSGDIVAYKLARKPEVREYRRFYATKGVCFAAKNKSTTCCVLFTEVDGVLDSVRLEEHYYPMAEYKNG